MDNILKVKRRIAERVVTVLVPLSLFLCISSVAVIPLLAQNVQQQPMPSIMALPLLFLAYLDLRRKHYLSAANLVIAASIVSIVVGLALNGGIHAPIYLLVLPIAAFTAWLYGLRAAILYTCAMLLLGIIAFLLMESGYIPAAPPIDSHMRLAYVVIYAVFIVGSTAIPNRMLHKALADSESQRDRLVQQTNVIEKAGDGIAWVDADGYVGYANIAWAHMHGFETPEELLGKHLSIFHTKEQLEKEVIPFNKHVLETGTHTIEMGHKRKDGSTFIAHMTVTAIYNDDGSLLSFVANAQDITERKQLEMRLRESEKFDAIGHLAGGVAHDFNNALGGIMGAAELIESRIQETDTDLRRYVNLILTTAERASELTSRLLEFSRRELSGSSHADAHESIRDALALLERSIDKNISIQTELAAAQSSFVGEPTELQNAMLNLGINARDAMPQGGTLTVSTRNTNLDATYCAASRFSLQPGTYLQILIRDTGGGMDKETCDHIFEPFFTTKGPGKGTGLGLSAVYGTISRHGGAIEVQSEPGKGSTFSIYLPVTENAPLPRQSGRKQISGARRGCILLADDEFVIRETTRQLLISSGFEVIATDNGKSALEIYKTEHARIDAVILDMIMPVMDGATAFHAIREVDPTAKVIVASGYADKDTLDAMQAQGVNGTINKPYRGNELANILADVIGESKKGAQN